MVYSYTQISQYLTCPRRYRHRYLDGWREKDTRAALLFGRAFESALAALFRREDSAAVLFREWSACRNQDLQYSKGDSWDRMLEQGIQLLERFCQDGRVRIRHPRRNLQVKVTHPISPNHEFVAYVDAIGYLDGLHCLLEWKTTSSRYPEEPEGLLALDPQLVCYSWITGIPEVGQVVFVRKRLVGSMWQREKRLHPSFRWQSSRIARGVALRGSGLEGSGSGAGGGPGAEGAVAERCTTANGYATDQIILCHSKKEGRIGPRPCWVLRQNHMLFWLWEM